MRIRPYAPADFAEWRRLRFALWPDQSRDEMAWWSARRDATTLVAARDGDGGLAGFAEVSERATAEGCETSPVAYLEGWYVDPDVRGQGVGAALVRAAEAWALARGLREIASDAEIDNVASQSAHRALGFAEVDRAVHYRKAIPGAADARPRSTRIGAKAVAVCRDGDRVLVEHGCDAVGGERFFRAIGGSIEFGERAADAARREWREELGIEIADVRLLGVLENRFTYEGAPGHEIVFVFEARAADPATAERIGIDPAGLRHEAVWVPLAELAAGGPPLRPDGVLRLLASR